MIELNEQLKQSIFEQGEKTYPNECCGFLLGDIDGQNIKHIKEIKPADNTKDAKEQYHRFKIEPQDFLNMQVYAMKKGLDILGFYHSHPDHPSAPSEYDREHALPFYSYIIVSIQKGKAASIDSWVLSADRAFEKETTM
jgi:proteasome lid subunit RPN8/RPN11